MSKAVHVPTIDELIELPTPSDPQISPDGRHVAYVVVRPDWEENEYRRQLWLADIEGSTTRQLTFAAQSSTSPRWSPDGQWLAFLSKREGDEHSQIYRMSPFGGEAERLTKLETDVEAIFWAPDGQSIAYLAKEPQSEAAKQRGETYGDYHVEDQDYERAQLWLLRLEDRKQRRLTAGEALHVVGVDWHPQEGCLALEVWPTPDDRDWDQARLYRLDVETLQLTPLTAAGCAVPRWSPDGQRLAFTRCGEPSYYANNELCLMPAGGGEIEVISDAFDEDIQLEDWGPDGLYFHAIQRTSIHLFRIDPESGACTRLTPEEPAGWASMEYSFSADFCRAALAGGDVDHCAEVTLLDLSTGTFRRLTEFTAETRDWQPARRELFSWTSGDGIPLEGVLVKPADFDPERRYPLLVSIHGGPSWVSLLARLTTMERLYYHTTLWAAKGALILLPNYRGSAGYGQAFRRLNVRNLGVGDYEDVISGVDALIERGWVDPQRVGAMGWSQGGYISAFIAAFSDRFRAVSMGAGIASWATYYVGTDVHPFTRQYLQATPWEDAEIYRRTSPIGYIERAQTPTLIQHGEHDRRVPISNAYEFYQALQDMGVEVKLVVYKDMPHGIIKPRLNRQVMQENLDWFNRWIWGEEAPAEAAPPCYVVAAGPPADDRAELPALQRYAAAPVQDVHHWARRDRADFRILSAQQGLLKPDDPTPPGDPTISPEALSPLAARVAEQIRSAGWKKLAFYSGEVETQPQALISLGCLQVAAGMVGGVAVQHECVGMEEWPPEASR